MTRRPKTRAAAEAKPTSKKAKQATGNVVTQKAAGPKAKAKAGANGAPPRAEAKRERVSSQTPAPSSPRPRSASSAVAKTDAPVKLSRTKRKPAEAAAVPAGAEAKVAASSSSAKHRLASAGRSKRRAAGTTSPAKAKPAARSKPKSSRKAPSTPTRAGRKASKPAYLAAELGQPVDREGEPIGAGSAMLSSDSALQEYALQLWRQMQSGGVVNRYMRAIEHAGLTVDEVWTAGVIETRTTSSTPDELRRYKQKLLFRANLLEAILSETVADLHRLEGLEPTPSPGAAATASTVGEPA